MIQTVEMYKAVCDSCKKDCDYGDFSCLSDVPTAREWAVDNDWHFTDNEKKCYCPNCYGFDDDDNLIIKSK